MVDIEVRNFFNDMSTEEWLHLAFVDMTEEQIKLRLAGYFDGRPASTIVQVAKLIYKQLHPTKHSGSCIIDMSNQSALPGQNNLEGLL